tara:strand:- start:224 stop:382 length:159 start_codon:yes stop_codon:yes gene_type:complete
MDLELYTNVGVLNLNQTLVIATETLWMRWVFAEEDVRKMPMKMEFVIVKMNV